MILLAEDSSSIINIHSLSNNLGLPRKELERYLFILDNTFVNYLINPFYTNRRRELSKSKKSVFYDNGMKNCLGKNFSDLKNRLDRGRLIESAVYNEIRKNLKPGMEILYWRTQHQTEIDFVIRYDEKIIPVEVKTGSVKRAPASIISFGNQYNCPFVIVVNKDNWHKEVVNGLNIYFFPVFLSSFLPSLIVK